MASNYEKNKQNIYRYKQTHLARWREINKRASKKRYSWHRIQCIFLQILLDPLHACREEDRINATDI